MRRRYRLAALALCVALISGPRDAECAEISALYQASWAGLPAGDIRLALSDDGALYRAEIAIRTVGLPRLVTRFRGSAVSDGHLAGAPLPRHYEALYDLRKSRDKRLSMNFASRTPGAAVIAERGPGDTSSKPPLAERYRTDVLDPLSALTAIRLELRHGNRGRFAIPVYDGARRFDVLARVLPKRDGDPALHLELTLAPIAGFKGETSSDGDPDDAPRPVAVTFSDDRRLMPLSMSVSLYYLPLVVQLTRWCRNVLCRW